MKSFASRRSPCFGITAVACQLNWLPIFGQAHSVVAIVRQPVDIDRTKAGQTRLLTRLAMAVNGRFPPGEAWRSA